MIPERDIWRSAQVIIRRHEAEAAVHATLRADELLALGVVEDAIVRERIVRAIK